MFFEVYESVLKKGEIVYDEKDGAFDILPYCVADSSILIEYIHLEFNSETKELMGLWGVSPKMLWIKSRLLPPKSIMGTIRFIGECESGKTIRLKEKVAWKYYYDWHSGWFCMKRMEDMDGDVCVEIIKDVLFELGNGKIKAIWIKPRFC